MNVAGYGQGLREIGTANLEDLARLERERERIRRDTNIAQGRAKGEAIGTMIGGVAGAAKGFYDTRKEDYERDQRNQVADYQNEMLAQQLEARASGRPIDPTKLPQAPKLKPYDFLDDMAKMFHTSGWVGGGPKE